MRSGPYSAPGLRQVRQRNEPAGNLQRVPEFEQWEQSMTRSGAYRPGQKRRDNEACIVAAAEREFASRGFQGASISRIAERAGVPRTNVHYYFNSKEELYGRLLSDIIRLWNDSFPEIKPADDPAEVLEAYVRAKITFSRTNPLSSKIFANEILRGAPLLRIYLEQDLRHWLLRRVRVIKTWIKQGKMDPVDPFHLIFMIWSSTQHYADFDVQVQAALGKETITRRDYDKAVATITHVLIKGCGISRN